MTSPLPVKVPPTTGQIAHAARALRSAMFQAEYISDGTVNGEARIKILMQEFEKAASALGLRLSADEEAAQQPQREHRDPTTGWKIAPPNSQQPSDLVKRLRHGGLPVELLAADRIEALEAAQCLDIKRPDWKSVYEDTTHEDDSHDNDLVMVTRETVQLASDALRKQNQTDFYHNYGAAERELMDVLAAKPDDREQEAP